jgi:hypothetical protein
MAHGFLDLLATPSVRAARTANGGEMWDKFHGKGTFDRFTEDESEFLSLQDSFYMATVAENGWPYIQHRGGPEGFLKVLDEKTLGFADFRGNRQYISIGNLAADHRCALILVDYPNRARLKILAHAETKDLTADPALAARLTPADYKAKVERGIVFHLAAFDWNCPQHITPRFTEAQLAPALKDLQERMVRLEAENQSLRKRLARSTR